MNHTLSFRALVRSVLVVGCLSAATAVQAQQAARVGDLVTRRGEVPRRVVGYGLVVGLDGTGDRSFGSSSSSAMTVRSVVNLLRRFNIEVPPDQMRLRNVAAVLVTAEMSPFLRMGGRFEVQVAALGDGTSLRGGVLWMTPLVSDPNQPPVATAQGPILVSGDGTGRVSIRQGNSGRITEGGVLEVDLPAPALTGEPRLALKRPDLRTASRIAAAINAASNGPVAKVEDPGSILLNPGPGRADSLSVWLAAIDTLPVTVVESPRIVIDGRDGSVVAGGDVRVGGATVSLRGITLQVGGSEPAPAAASPDSASGGRPLRDSSATSGLVHAGVGSTVQEIVAVLYAAGAKSQDLVAIFDALRASGAIRADVVIR
jgi:flagellar P-ring protein precursor FlgI